MLRAASVGSHRSLTTRRSSRRSAPAAFLGDPGGDLVAVELEEVVGRGDESPLASAGGPAAAGEAFERAVELDLAEDGLDRDLALAIELAALRCGQDAAHEVKALAGPAGPG